MQHIGGDSKDIRGRKAQDENRVALLLLSLDEADRPCHGPRPQCDLVIAAVSPLSWLL